MDINELSRILREETVILEELSVLSHEFQVSDAETRVVYGNVEAADLAIAFTCIASEHEFRLTTVLKKNDRS